MKRAQVTLFIIMAIFIVAAIGIFFLLQSNVEKSSMSVDTSRVYNFVKSCADDVYLDTIYDVGMRGGYYNSPSESVSFGIPLYKVGDRLIFPEVETIEKEIAKGFDRALMECAQNFSSFSDLDVVAQKANSVADVRDDRIILDVVYPMTVTKDEASDSLRNFETIDIPSQMGLMHRIAYEIAAKENVSNICLTCLSKLADDNHFKIDIVDYDVNVVFIVISYEELDGRIFEFSFAMKK